MAAKLCVGRLVGNMLEKSRLQWPWMALLLGAGLAACGTTAPITDDGDELTFVVPDGKGDLPVSHPDVQDTGGTDATVDTPDVEPELPPDVPDVVEVADDVPDVADSGPPDVYIPECVTDTTCDDKDLCTVDLCANDKCKHSPTPGCCHVDADCPKAPTCKAATCVDNACVNTPVANCCASGVCCDPVKQSVKVPQAPCTDSPIAFEFSCNGLDIWGRRALPGCDGKQTAACSGNEGNYSWTEWLPVSSCPGGSLCQKNPDKAVMPTCSGAPAPVPSCIDDIGCYDGDPCTNDACVSGACTHVLADSATLCGTTATFTQFGCLDAPGGGEPGGSIITHSQFVTCGPAGKCDGKVGWSPWTIINDCLPTEKCDVPISTEPGTCALVAVCKPGTMCCGADGQYLPTGTACGSAIVATEYKCDSADKGSKFSKRDGIAGCAGTTALCSAATPNWNAWKPAGDCAYNQTCSLPIADSPPICTDVCTAGTTCCTDAGDWSDQGSKCADALLKTISKCSAANGIETVLSTQLFPGCTGTDGTCSTDVANLFQSAYNIVKTCQSYEKCVQTGDAADCVLNAPCTPGTQCCTADGQFAPTSTPCKPNGDIQYSCSNNLPGGAVLTRDVEYGCSGFSTECSYNPADYYYSPWFDAIDCQPSEACTSTDLTFAECNTIQVCQPGSICCDGTGQFMAKGTKCGNQGVQKTYYQCSSADLNGSILKQEYYASCVGTAANCSSLDPDLVWDPPVWLSKQACGPMNYCHVSGPTDPGLCNSTPP
jgi:hypothetical protein